MNRNRSAATFLGVAFLLTGCSANKPPQAPAPKPVAPATQPEAPAPAPSPAPAPTAIQATPQAPRPGGNASLGDGVRWFRSAAEYPAITISTYRAATEAVVAATRGKERDSWAVVLDADETVLDNSVFQLGLTQGVRFSEEAWAAFVKTRVSIPVPGAKAFLDRVKELGGRIVIVTNRFEPLCEDTRENFKAQGLPFDAILCRATTGTNTGDKNPRFEAAATGAALGDNKTREVVAFVGDNILDFPKQTQQLKDAPPSAFDPFGRRFFILPNPMYGSWQQTRPR